METRSGPLVLWAVNPAGDSGVAGFALGDSEHDPSHVVPSDEVVPTDQLALAFPSQGAWALSTGRRASHLRVTARSRDNAPGVCPPPPQLPSAAVERATAPGDENSEDGTEPAMLSVLSDRSATEVSLFGQASRGLQQSAPAEAPDVRCQWDACRGCRGPGHAVCCVGWDARGACRGLGSGLPGGTPAGPLLGDAACVSVGRAHSVSRGAWCVIQHWQHSGSCSGRGWQYKCISLKNTAEPSW